MSILDAAAFPGKKTGLLVDTNLLVLFAVGGVNRRRIETFKRTRQYTIQDFDLLVNALNEFQPIYTVAHILAEVSNLTDLQGTERLEVRRFLKEMISELNEIEMSSAVAASDRAFEQLGLTDAAMAAVARKHHCPVLTDDLDLYLALSRDGMDVFNFTHLRAQRMGV